MSRSRLFVMFAVLFVVGAGVAARGQEPRERVTVEPAVYQELAAGHSGQTYVVVLLDPGPLPASVQAAERLIRIAAVQDRVLNELAPTEFVLVYRYQNFAALTGWGDAVGLAKLAAHADVSAVGVDGRGQAHLAESVPFIGADVAHNSGYTGRGITVAVLDTGIDTNHPDLSDHVAAGAWHFLDQGADQGAGAEDDNGHGTNVSGIITSKGTVAPVGVAPDAEVLPVKVLKADSSGWVSDWAAGVDYVVSVFGNYAHLGAINMSLGTDDLYTQCPCDNVNTYTQLLQASLAAAKGYGIATFASSGNAGSCNSMSSPACLSAAAAVAAVYDQNYGREPDSGTYWGAYGDGFSDCFDAATAGDKIACFSNRSSCNKLAAPGRLITSAGMGGGTSVYTGTSQAAPHCTALAALMDQRGDEVFVWYTADYVINTMVNTGVTTTDPCSTSPNPKRINVMAALRAVGVGEPCQLSKVTASDGAMNGLFGRWVDIDGDVMVVGRESPPSAYVYRRNGTQWVEEAKLVANDANSYYFGYTVGVSGNVIVVGDPWFRILTNNNVGAAFVFRYSGGTWAKETRLTASDWAANDWFGTVAIDGNRIVVGAHLNDDACPTDPNCDSGSAYVFEYSGGAWSQVAKLLASDASQGDRFGQAVAISGDRIIVGAYYDDAPAADSGSAYIFERNGSGTWVQQPRLTASDGAAGDQFGCKVAIDGDLAVVSAYLDDNAGGTDAGAVYVFRRGATTWTQEAKLTASDAAANDRFGNSAAVSGNHVLVGAYQDDDAGAESGSAYVFEYSGSTWWQKDKFTASDAASGDAFGFSVALSGGRAAIGARQDDSNAGSAYVFAVADDCNHNGMPDLCDIASGYSTDVDNLGIPDECKLKGDMNCDGAVNNQDIDPFVQALFHPAQYVADHDGDPYPPCSILRGDFTGDRLVNNQDIDGFVDALFGP